MPPVFMTKVIIIMLLAAWQVDVRAWYQKVQWGIGQLSW
jgi:hypothetical protein